MKTLFIVPARGGSVRLERKNTRPFLEYNEGLVERLLIELSKVSRKHDTVLTTDIDALKELCIKHGAYFHRRDDALCGPVTPMEPVIEEVLSTFKKWDVFCLAQPTSPGTVHYDFEMAIDAMQSYPCKALVSVNRYTMKPNGGYYFVHRDSWTVEKSLYPPGMHIQTCDNIESIDIDTIEDFRVAEAVVGGRMLV